MCSSYRVGSEGVVAQGPRATFRCCCAKCIGSLGNQCWTADWQTVCVQLSMRYRRIKPWETSGTLCGDTAPVGHFYRLGRQGIDTPQSRPGGKGRVLGLVRVRAWSSVTAGGI
jgi:hypothetical protein